MSLLPPKVTLMSVSTSNTYMKLQNFRKLGKNAKLSKKPTLPISGQNLLPKSCPLIRDYTVSVYIDDFFTKDHTSKGCFNTVISIDELFAARNYYLVICIVRTIKGKESKKISKSVILYEKTINQIFG